MLVALAAAAACGSGGGRVAEEGEEECAGAGRALPAATDAGLRHQADINLTSISQKSLCEAKGISSLRRCHYRYRY